MKDEVIKNTSKFSRKFFFRAGLITLGIVVVVIIVALLIGKHLFDSMNVGVDYEEYEPKATHHIKTEDGKGEKPKIQDRIIMVFGVDKEAARTDTIMVVHLDSQTEEVSVVSIPRDTKVSWSREQRDKAVELGRLYEYESKITDMSSLGGIENLRYFTIRSVEEMLDVRVDSYVVVNTEVIRDLVDALGGIEVDVPRRMEYDDNYQDLHIDLQPGLQVLNGEEAEGLLRWRHNKDYSEQYAMGDLGRIETQQLFIEAFADKVINDMPVAKLTEIATVVYKNIQTDIKFKEIIDYVKYIPFLKLDNIEFQTLPGTTANIGGRSYYIADEAALPTFVDQYFYGIIESPSDYDDTSKSDTNVRNNYNNSSSYSGNSNNTSKNSDNNSNSSWKGDNNNTTHINSNSGIENEEAIGLDGIVEGDDLMNDQDVMDSDDAVGNEGIIKDDFIMDSEGVTDSSHITNSEGVTDSSHITNSEGVGDSSHITNSEGVTDSSNVTDSEEIKDNNNLVGSESIIDHTTTVNNDLSTESNNGMNSSTSVEGSSEIENDNTNVINQESTNTPTTDSSEVNRSDSGLTNN